MSCNTKLPILLLLLMPFFSYRALSQDSISQDSLSEKQEEGNKKEEKPGKFVVLPIITSSPETSLRLGVISIYFFRFRNAPVGTRLSAVRFPLSYTIRNQIKIRSSFEFSFPGNKHIVDGQIFWIRFPLLFYGIGSNSLDQDEEIYTTQTALLEVNYYSQVSRSIFLGGRLDVSNGRIVKKDENGMLKINEEIPGRNGGRKVGLGFTARWDRRENIVNPTRGPFLGGAFTLYPRWLGSEFEYSKLRLDLRHYIPLLSHKYILALQTLTEYNWGNPPFEYMALLGGDEIMRGHLEGRFRDRAMWATQAELRIPFGRDTWLNQGEIPFRQRWGCVVFAGAGNVSPDLARTTWNNLKTSLGFGIRYLISRDENVNIRIDFALGTQRPGFYLNIRESF